MMTAAYATERRLRHDQRKPLNDDDSLVPGKAAASIMHLGEVTDFPLAQANGWSLAAGFALIAWIYAIVEGIDARTCTAGG